MFNINPKQINKMMQQMGMRATKIDAKEVRIICDDETIIIESPGIQKITMQGQTSFQITGTEKKINNSQLGKEEMQNKPENKISFSDEDIKMIIEQTGKSRDIVEKKLKKTGDIAQTILLLNKKF
ncbi:MAG: NagC family transcriptional regulator [Candidatus Aenigmarchaeota archaeon ex4484_52]|nr:MAG: NagC family transcriptional regulator [Candidatus Aenigmarchaeota archaeon ex4484_52]